MEEADLLKERLQIITEKRRIQEDIAKKRREIEEEKLKLQYIKKKAVREQWLMDGLTQQSEQEQEAMRLQAQDEQRQSDMLQSNIIRKEEEIQFLEAQEISICVTEENILKLLKEVERTPDDIIKKSILSDKEEPDGKEVNQGCSETKYHHIVSVTMETPEQSPVPADSEIMVSLEQGKSFSADDEQVFVETSSPKNTEEERTMLDSYADDLQTGAEEIDNPDFRDTSVSIELPCQDQEKVFALDSADQEYSRTGSVTSSVSNTQFSAESVFENEVDCETQDTHKQDLEVQSPKIHHYLEQNPESIPEQNPNVENNLKIEDHSQPEPQEYPEVGFYLQQEQHSEVELYLEPDEVPNLDLYPKTQQDMDVDFSVDPAQQSYLEMYSNDDLGPKDNEYEIVPTADTEETPDNQEIQHELSISQGSPLKHCTQEAKSDEKWRTIFSSSINKEDDDSYLDSLELSAQELFVPKLEDTEFEEPDNNVKEVSFEVPQVEVLEQPDEIISFTGLAQELKYNLLGFQGLSKISEDESENAKDINHHHITHQEHSSVDQNKKMPKDFCVIQETKSENVSTEHVDFQLAQKQWREMEKQTKNRIMLPTIKQPSFHGSHSFMYKPVRKIERDYKKALDMESLNLVGDYIHTQTSPCSEDSGVDDSSYRSPCDEPETSLKGEFCQSLNRNDNFRREELLSRMGKSTDCNPSRSMPRSMSTPLTPPFIITSSPTKESLHHEVSANNVVILDPSSNRLSKDSTAAQSGEWHSEGHSSNLIILETSNLIIRSASDFSLNKAQEPQQEKMFLNNPFFKLRSRSTISLVDEEIKMVNQREEELKKERANLYGQDVWNAERTLSNQMDTLAFKTPAIPPEKCKSSPSSPMKVARRMNRSALSCDQRFPEEFTRVRRKSAMALRWEAGEFAKND
uniref:Palmdelphin n=1 Tax=Cynoglossus semilaevis TaxID=244447 RepID=A0A3P8VH31_CYNSE